MKNVFPNLRATLLIGVTAAVATVSTSPALASEAGYLQKLSSLQAKLSPAAQRIVESLGNSNNLVAGQGMCSLLASSTVQRPADLIIGVKERRFFNIPKPPLPDNSQRRDAAISQYLVASTFAASTELCPQYANKVRSMFPQAFRGN